MLRSLNDIVATLEIPWLKLDRTAIVNGKNVKVWKEVVDQFEEPSRNLSAETEEDPKKPEPE
jgi:hypothetical protein